MSVKKMEAIQSSSCDSDKVQVLESKESKPTKCINDSHAVQLVEGLQSLRKDDVLCDIMLKTDDGAIVEGHKNVLISVSPYFCAMFSNFNERNKELVHLRDLDSTGLKFLVDYIYTGEILVTKENAQVLLSTANVLQLDYVSAICENFMKTQLSASNCLGTNSFADLHNCIELFSSSEAYIKKHFLEVSECEEFLSLSFEEVIKHISCDDLTVPFEEKVFKCVINWVKHELDGRKDFLPKLMEHVRLPLVSTQYLIKALSEEPLIKNSLQCKDYIIEALYLRVLNSEKPFTIPKTIWSRLRQSGGLQKVILIFNQSATLPKLYTELYDPATNQKKIASEMNDCNKAAGLGVIRDTFVFTVGGVTDDDSSSQSVNMLDLSSQSPCWLPMAKMLVSRQDLGVGVLNDCIYAIGGSDGISILDTAEVFDFKEWRMVASMSTVRQELGVAVLNDRLYAIGGWDGENRLNSVECYDPILNTWTPFVEMSVGRDGVGVGVMDGAIYVMGGCGHLDILRSAEVFRPSEGVWSPIADMHLCRYKPGVVTLNGLLYVMGGHDGSDYLDSVEIYNANTNTWSMESLSRNDLYIYGGVVVDRPPHFITN